MTKKNIPYILTLSVFLLNVLNTQARILTGACASPKLQENFDLTKYAGTWYEIMRDKDFKGEKDGECVT